MSDDTTNDTSGIRKPLIERPAFIELVFKNATFDLETGEATGFETVLQALMKKIKRDREYSHQYLRGRLKVCIKQGILMPVFTDVSVIKREGARAKKLKAAQEIAFKAMEAAGVSPALISKHVDVVLGISGRRAEDQVGEE